MGNDSIKYNTLKKGPNITDYKKSIIDGLFVHTFIIKFYWVCYSDHEDTVSKTRYRTVLKKSTVKDSRDRNVDVPNILIETS